MALSNGYYVAFLDDDDEWLPEKIEKQIKGFTDDSIAIVYCGQISIDEIIGEKHIRKTKIQRGNVFSELIMENFIGSTSNPLIRKTCIEEVGRFDEQMQSSQDYDLCLRITQRYSVNYIELPLLNYYIHAGERISADVDRKNSWNGTIES